MSIKNILITGANRGMGLAMVQALAKQSSNWNLIMACKNLASAHAAKQNILKQYPKSNVNVQQLDISNNGSIEQMVRHVKDKYKQIDVLVNNAAISKPMDDFSVDSMEQLFNTNFYGTVSLTQALLPSMKQKGKVLFAGARFGKIAKLRNQQLKKRFTAPDLDKDGLFKLMDQFQQDLIKGGKQQVTKNGWIPYTYMMTKLGINNYAKVLCSNPIVKEKQLLVSSFCPGFVKTQLTESLPDKGKVPVQQGIVTVMHLIQQLPFQPNNDYMGKIFEQKAPQSI